MRVLHSRTLGTPAKVEPYLTALYNSTPSSHRLTQVDTAGDSLAGTAMSASGEALVFGGTGGYIHM
jgi:hypothetical protein